MEDQKDILGMLDLITAPGFCVKENRIIKANAAAAGLFFAEGMEIIPLLASGAEEYRAFAGGCLCLTITQSNQVWTASVTRLQDMDVFILEPDISRPELQALALAARELRAPLNNAMLMADKLLHQENPEILDSVSRLNRGLYQLLRIVGNMSDAGYIPTGKRHSLHEINTVMDEIMQKAAGFTEASGIQLRYTDLPEVVYTLCDPEQLERAVMNILSNAIKFTPKGGSIEASLTCSSHLLRLSIQDSGSGIADSMLRSLFSRYLRQPSLEDSRYGIGLGMVLIRNAAVQHGGTVLIDQPDGTGTRVTITIAIRQEEPTFRSKVLHPTAGGYDTGLIELSEVLPATMFDGTK